MRVLAIALLAATGVGVSTQPFSCFPRMSRQPSIKPFERRMPRLPEHLVPFAAAPAFPQTKEQAARMPNPVKATPEAIALGRIYYGYYCQQCHGPNGNGDGAVARSYVPAPSGLTTPRVRAMSDGALCFAMVAGAGHESPRHERVLEPTVALDRRWHIVLYLRTISGVQSKGDRGTGAKSH
jgi:hypothetical protein